MIAWFGLAHFIHLPGVLVGAALCYGIAGAGLLALRGVAAASPRPSDEAISRTRELDRDVAADGIGFTCAGRDNSPTIFMRRLISS